ncbi:MAG: hypothetical protein JKY56_02250 [Kofleriaceae bacterium]|nr:hypothetical protein [Kofleriaceae bacterium]
MTPDASSERVTSPLWESQEPINISISGPMQTAFDAAFAGQPDGFFPPIRIKESFLGELRYTAAGNEVVLQVKLKVRGNSSLQECAFPKMKISTFVDDERANSIFYKAKRVKIGTHCADLGDDDTGIIGRLRNQKAAYRESFIYQMMRKLDMPSKWTRPALITYTDTSATGLNTGWTVERMAFLFDNADNLVKRYGLALREEGAWGQADSDKVNRLLAAKIHFLHALIGNWDWELPLVASGPQAPWNMHFLVGDGGELRPVAYDFDLSSVVTGKPYRANQLPDELYPDEPLLFRQAAYFLLPSKTDFDEATRDEAVRFFRAAEPILRTTLNDYPMDMDGKQLHAEHMNAFYDVLDREYP